MTSIPSSLISKPALLKRFPSSSGRPSKNGPEVAHIDAMRRDGDVLHANLSGVNPPRKATHGFWHVEKEVVQIQGHGMSEGPSITSVGLVQRQHGAGGVWQDCPETEAGLNALCEDSGKLSAESQFADRSAPSTQVSFSEGVRPKKLIDVNGQRPTTWPKSAAEQKSDLVRRGSVSSGDRAAGFNGLLYGVPCADHTTSDAPQGLRSRWGKVSGSC